MTLHLETLPGGTAQTFKKLGGSHLLDHAYLAGGTAVAIQIGHRVSHDLDFFTPEKFDERVLTSALEELGMKPEQVEWQTVTGNFRSVHFSCFFYKYPLLFKTFKYEGIHIVDLRDTAAMKVEAIGARGTKRDFVDLYASLHYLDLHLIDIIRLYEKKYRVRRDTVIHILKSLEHFADAESQQIRCLELLQPIDWEEVKSFFRQEVERTSHKLLKGESA